jgi:hypothetical protein
LRLRAFAFINRVSIGPKIFAEMRDSAILLRNAASRSQEGPK